MTENEWKTRKTRIGIQLKALNCPWKIIPFEDGLGTSRLVHHAVEEDPNHEPTEKLLECILAEKAKLDNVNKLRIRGSK